jgi:hypothetical protein
MQLAVEKMGSACAPRALSGALAGQSLAAREDSPFGERVRWQRFPAGAPKTAGEGARATLSQLHGYG